MARPEMFQTAVMQGCKRRDMARPEMFQTAVMQGCKRRDMARPEMFPAPTEDLKVVGSPVTQALKPDLLGWLFAQRPSMQHATVTSGTGLLRQACKLPN